MLKEIKVQQELKVLQVLMVLQELLDYQVHKVQRDQQVQMV